MGMTNGSSVDTEKNLITTDNGEVVLKANGAPEEIRTPDRWYRKPVLYPAELRTHISFKRLKL
jgi:hypothetical protein